MPHASYKAIVEAPYERVSALLIDKMEWPKKYVGAILYSSVLERGDGYIIREMYQPKPVDLIVREKISRHDIMGGQEFVYEHINNASYSGTFRNVLTRVPGDDSKVEVEYIMSWDPHPGTADKISDDAARANIEHGVNHLKALAENEVEVPDWIRAFYGVVDSMGSDAMAPLLADKATFRMGNGPVVVGRDNVVAGSRDVTKMFAGIRHDYVAVHQSGTSTFVDCWVTYTMFDDTTYVLPSLTVFDRVNDEITDVKIFVDLSPLRHGWPA